MLSAIAHGKDAFQQDVTARPLDRIVVGVDFSEVSLAAAQWVGRHLARDAALTLVHVVEPPPLPNVSRLHSARMPDLESRLQGRIESLRGALHGLSTVVGGTGTRVEVRVGDPALQLAAYADMVAADLVVVGGNAVSRTAPRHETATTHRLLRRLARPGLVARNVPGGAYNRSRCSRRRRCGTGSHRGADGRGVLHSSGSDATPGGQDISRFTREGRVSDSADEHPCRETRRGSEA